MNAQGAAPLTYRPGLPVILTDPMHFGRRGLIVGKSHHDVAHRLPWLVALEGTDHQLGFSENEMIPAFIEPKGMR